MPVYAADESDEVDKQPEQEPTDDQCRRLEDANMAAMAAQMDALMAQLRTRLGVEPVQDRQSLQTNERQHPQIRGQHQ